MPEPDEAQQQAEQQAASQPPEQASSKQAAQQKKFLKSTASDPGWSSFENKIGKTKGVKSVSAGEGDKTGDAAVFTVIATTAPSATRPGPRQRPARRRDPRALKGGLTAYVGGTTAGYIDLADRIGEKLPLGDRHRGRARFLLLMLAFRSIVVPLDGGAHEPALGRRRLRHPHRRLREGLRASTLIGLDARDPDQSASCRC